MGQNSSAIQEIKNRLNIVELVSRYVDLRRNGNRWVAICPFHQETKPSFSVNEEEGTFYCFGCQASGDIFTFYGMVNGMNFRESLEQLAEETGVSLQNFSWREGKTQDESSHRRQLLKMHELAESHFVRNLASKAGKECRDYIAKRRLSDEIVQRFGLGWSLREWQALTNTFRRAGFPDNLGVESALLGRSETNRIYDRFRGRLIFPIRSLSGNIIAFGGRIIADEDEAKYVNSSDSPLYKKGDHLYGLQQARRSVSTGKPFMLTEGYMDVLTLHQYGYTNAVGVLGTALTPEQVKRLSGFTSKVELLFDGDRAGRKAALRACEMFLSRGMECKVILFPEGEDIDSLLHTAGQDIFEQLRTAALAGFDFCVATLKEMSPRDALEWAENFLAQLEFPELAGRYATAFATQLDFSEQAFRDQVVAKRNARQATPKLAEQKNPTAEDVNIHEREIMTFVVRYPYLLPKVQEARLFLLSAWAKALWQKIEDQPSDEVFSALNTQEKNFWLRCRNDQAPPRNPDYELTTIKSLLDSMALAAQMRILSAALEQNDNLEDKTAYLQAFQETLEKENGEY